MRWTEIMKQVEVVTPPTSDAPLISLEDIKWHCRDVPDPDITDFDSLYRRYCSAAEKKVESLTEYTFRQQTKKLVFQDFPYKSDNSPIIKIPLEAYPVSSIVHFKYYDTSDTLQTLASTKYEGWLSHVPPFVAVRSINAPALSTERTKAAEIQFVCGYSGAIPENAILAMLLLIAFWKSQPESEGRLPPKNANSRAFYTLISTLRWRPDIA